MVVTILGTDRIEQPTKLGRATYLNPISHGKPKRQQDNPVGSDSSSCPDRRLSPLFRVVDNADTQIQACRKCVRRLKEDHQADSDRPTCDSRGGVRS